MRRKALRAPARLADRSGAGVRARPRAFAAQAVEQLRSSEGWEQWLAARRLFHAYGLANQLLIAIQKPEAAVVADFRAWLKRLRQRDFLEAAEGTRTLDLLHGKQT